MRDDQDFKDQKDRMEWNTEFAEEATPRMDANYQDNRERNNTGVGIGIAGIVFSILAFFLWPYLMAPIGIILGVMSVSRKSAAGWWAVGIGVIALILVTMFTIFAIPFRIFF